MDIPTIKTIPTPGNVDSLRRWAVPAAMVLAFVAWDLVTEYMHGPVMNYFFPRLYVWLSIGLVGVLVWSTLRAIKVKVWRLAAAAVFLVAAVLVVVGAPDSFPFFAPGQDKHVVEGQRIRPVEKVTFNAFGAEIRPGTLDNKVDDVVLSLKKRWKSLFRNITGNLLKVMVPLDKALREIPMWLFIGVTALIAWRVSGYKVAAVSVVGLLFIGVFDLWRGAMLTMTVVGTSTFLSIALAIPVGIAMSKSDRLEGIVRPVLDMMQTMPSFVYLIPAIFFLGIGMVPAVMATLVYAVPPAIRLTNLGIRLVSQDLIEAARAFGTTPWQLLVKIQLPLARPTIMAGVNQTVMMALAMVVVAALVGAGGLGADVYAGIQQLEFGRGLMGGLGIVVLAVIIDRVSQGFAKDPRAQRLSS